MIDSLYEPFKAWSQEGKIWLVSDPHFGDYDEKDWLPAEKLLQKITDKVRPCDTFVCLGDCGTLSFFNEIRCSRKVLLKGNHDRLPDADYKAVFDEVYAGPLFISDRILLSHEPVYGLTFCINIHGHMHSGQHSYTDERGGRHLNLVGPAVDYEPCELGAMLENGLTTGLTGIHDLGI